MGLLAANQDAWMLCGVEACIYKRNKTKQMKWKKITENVFFLIQIWVGMPLYFTSEFRIARDIERHCYLKCNHLRKLLQFENLKIPNIFNSRYKTLVNGNCEYVAIAIAQMIDSSESWDARAIQRTLFSTSVSNVCFFPSWFQLKTTGYTSKIQAFANCKTKSHTMDHTKYIKPPCFWNGQ